jgi:hypothetical protein
MAWLAIIRAAAGFEASCLLFLLAFGINYPREENEVNEIKPKQNFHILTSSSENAAFDLN